MGSNAPLSEGFLNLNSSWWVLVTVCLNGYWYPCRILTSAANSCASETRIPYSSTTSAVRSQNPCKYRTFSYRNHPRLRHPFGPLDYRIHYLPYHQTTVPLTTVSLDYRTP